MDNSTYPDSQQQVRNAIDVNQDVTRITDPLALNITDEELADIVKERINASEDFFEAKYNLRKRRTKNENYLFGRQIDLLEKAGKLKGYETRSNDNVIYEIEASLKPLAMSKLPDIIVTKGGEGNDREQAAKDLTTVLNDQIKSRELRTVLGLGFKHLPVYFTAVIKARWDNSMGKFGDAKFEIINPNYIVVDHTCTSKNPDDMGFIAQLVPYTIQDLIMMFPSKKTDILEQAKLASVQAGNAPTWKDLATEVKIWEVWFDWYKQKDNKALLNKEQLTSIYEPGVKWENVSGLLWKFGDIILDKMLDPNFDQEGVEKTYTYATPGDETTKQEVTPQQMLISAITSQPIPNMTKERVYNNYFDRPHKPFYFFGYDQWGKVYLDETSRIEQNIRNQDNLDDQNKTILDQIKTRVKHIWGADSGLRKADIQRLDMNDPKLDVRVEGNPNLVHAAVNPERPDAAQFNALGDKRNRMYAISGSTAIRGQLQSSVATSNQIAREADFTRSDDLVEDTINSACEWVAGWRMQFIKLRYTQDHITEILGASGVETYVTLRRDTVLSGMQAKIKSSSTDKLKAQRNAMDSAKLGAPYTNPLDFFNDMDMSDPEGRAERGIMMSIDPNMYFTKYILKLDSTQQQATALNSGVPAGQQTPPEAPQNPNPTDTTQVAATPPVNAPQGSPRNL